MLFRSIAWDHINVFPTFPEYVATFRKFIEGVELGGSFIWYKGDENLRAIAEGARKDITCIPYDAYEGNVQMQVFGKHNMQNLQAAMLACHCIGVSPDDFYREISSFTGASNRLEKICETETSVAYKDFAHSPSKLKATINAVRERYPNKKLIACMELHTFSSLMADFLPQYKGCMAEADVAYVYFNPKVIEHKRLTPITKEEVREAFGTENVEVFTESEALQKAVSRQYSVFRHQGVALLMMSSGTFDGVDVKQFAAKLLTT